MRLYRRRSLAISAGIGRSPFPGLEMGKSALSLVAILEQNQVIFIQLDFVIISCQLSLSIGEGDKSLVLLDLVMTKGQTSFRVTAPLLKSEETCLRPHGV
ncbi:hypothetical protein Cni_G19476 [Canna indica]|uniref:Uncharacterized protein n=1 Tax=Canna indica TaxID=4628 RepID=A0AAQ3KN97_9LILI|nr:hypothetical protein Cni_G19476 [Canna indica]